MNIDRSLELQRQLISALRQRLEGEHPIDLIETHISWVLLAPHTVYKIKKAVNLGFLDFSSLTQREHFCREELRLNQRLAPWYYVDIIGISGTFEHPDLGGAGNVIEYALRMRRFPPYRLMSDHSADLSSLSIFHTLADRLADFHVNATRTGSATPYGSPDSAFGPANDNIKALLSCVTAADARVELKSLNAWQEQWYGHNRPRLAGRKQDGWIREGHGDLHFGNIAVATDELIIFDCLEFDPALRWIDVCCDFAFLIMDCLYRDLWKQAIAFLNRYLEITGDYPGIALLRFYVVYRALVRAKINAIRAQQTGSEDAWRETHGYIALANRAAHESRSMLILTCGVSGSGKSYISEQLLTALPATRVRSDVERKRLFALEPLERVNTFDQTLLYSHETTARTYARLLDCATGMIEGGIPIIVDATFQRQAQREPFLALARTAKIPCVIVHTTASATTLQKRIRERSKLNNDASDADLHVLDLQQRDWEPLSTLEQRHVLEVNTDEPIDLAGITAAIKSI